MPTKIQSTSTPTDEVPLTIDHLLCLRASQIPDNPILVYSHNRRDYTLYTVLQLNTFAYRAGKYYKKATAQCPSSETPEKFVALLATSNFDYGISKLAKLAITVLLLSTRISDEGYRYLLKKTRCSDIVAQLSFEKTIHRVQSGYEGALKVVVMAG